MKIVCLCEQTPQTSSLISTLEKHFEVPLLLIPQYEDSTSRKSPKRQITVKKAFNHLYFKLLKSLTKCDRLHQLFDKKPNELTPSPKTKPIEILSSEINSSTTKDRLQKAAPDYLFVCGAPLLKKEIFEIPRFGCINLHFGISPDYRGHHTLLFPYLEKNYEKLGATLHFIDEGIDTGKTLVQIYPEVRSSDSPEDLEAKVILLVQEVLVELFEQKPQLEKQLKTSQAKGRLIRFQDYGVCSDLRCALRLLKNRVLSKEKILAKERIVHFSKTKAVT